MCLHSASLSMSEKGHRSRLQPILYGDKICGACYAAYDKVSETTMATVVAKHCTDPVRLAQADRPPLEE